MRLWLVFLILAVGCRKADDEDSADGTRVMTPAPCVADAQVCIQFGSDWSQEAADDLCDELEGTQGTCPEDELGRCVMDDGREYLLYDMPPLEAADYCDFMFGEWVKPGDEVEEG